MTGKAEWVPLPASYCNRRTVCKDCRGFEGCNSAAKTAPGSSGRSLAMSQRMH